MSDLYDPSEKYSLHAAVAADQMGLGQELVHGGVAAVVDAGATMWNSLTPQSMEADTGDLLSRIDGNALQVYNEHPDAVKTASFIGGMFLPIGLAMKGMTALRAGAKGASWFSEAGRVSRLAEVKAAYEGGFTAAGRLKDAQRMYYAANAANMVTDMVAAELSINIAMSSSPMMEDYRKDMGSNFLFSVALGSGIGGVVGHIIARGEINAVKIGVDKELTSNIKNLVVAPEPAEMNGTQFLRRHQNVENVKAFLQDNLDNASPLVLTKRTEESLRLLASKEEAQLTLDFYKAAPEMETLPIEVSSFYKDLISQPKFAGVENIRFYNPVGKAPMEGKKSGVLQSSFQFAKDLLNPKTELVELTKTDGVYLPIFDAFVGVKEAVNYSSIADLNKTIEVLETEAKMSHAGVGHNIRPDAAIQASVASTAEVQEDFAKALLAFKNTSFEEAFKKGLAVAPDDLASIKAINARIEEWASEGLDIQGIKIKVTKMAPSYNIQEVRAIHGAGFSQQYLKDLGNVNKERAKYQVFDGTHSGNNNVAAGISDSTVNIMQDWLHGSYNQLRNAALDYMHPQAGIKFDQVGKLAFNEIKNHPNSVTFRARMSAMADADGNVLLYRGLKNDPKGHRPLESYTLSPGKAKAFTSENPTGLRLYKVHVDDIVGTMEDFSTTADKAHSNSEILVLGRATRENAAVPLHDINAAPSKFFSQEGALEVKSTITPGIQEMNIQEFSDLIGNATMEQIREMQKLGFGFETISLRTGTPLSTVQKVLTSAPENLLFDELSTFANKTQIEQAIAPTKRALAMETNMLKIPSEQIQAQLNKSSFDTISQQFVEAEILSSSSSFVRELGNNLLSDEARAQLHFISESVQDITLSGQGSTFFRSANSVLERLGPVGQMITGFGKHIVDAKNTAKERFTTPLSQALTAVAKDEVAVLEFNNAINIQAGSAGAKFFKNGQFWKLKAGQGKESIANLVNMTDDQFVLWASAISKETGEAYAVPLQFKGKDFKVVTPSAIDSLKQIQSAGRELYSLKNVSHRSVGKGDLSDIGFWAPAANPRGKQIAYAFNKRTQETTMLMAKSTDELMEGIGKYKASLGIDTKFVDVVTKGDDQKFYNILAGRHDPMYMGVADLSKQHGGASARAVVSTNTEVMADLIQGYDHYIGKGIDDIAQLQLNPIMEHLDNLSVLSQHGYAKESLSQIEQMTKKPTDPGQVIKNILLGRSNIGEHQWWVTAQSGMQSLADRGLKHISEIVGSHLGGKGARTPEQWSKVSAEMEARGITNPFQVLDDYIDNNGMRGVAYKIDETTGRQVYLSEGKLARDALSPRLVALSNGVAATMLLRVAELAQPIVNMLSLPILTSGAVSRKMAASFMGAEIDPMAKFTLTETIYNGTRLMNHPTEGLKWSKIAEEKNLFRNDWRTVNGIMQQVRSLEPGMMTKLEDAMDSKLVTILSKPADMSEEFVRRITFFNGVALAKKAYPNLSDAGVVTFARSFMDEAIGNYAAAQRPAVFQGTVGVAMGLFQTYMLTMAQQVFRQIEHRDWRALGKMMLTQNTIFGTASLPGFHPISEAIGDHFSDSNFDLQTGTFRAVGDETATILLYGLPSQLIGLNTRGDIQPRIPNPLAGIDSLAAVNMTKSVYTGMERIVKAAYTADANTGQAMLEALSLQSISRPVARMSELLAGHSITASGKMVSTDLTLNPTKDEFWQLGTLARVMATRPIEEIKAREAMHLDTLYGTLDRDKRKATTAKLKSYVANGNLDQEKLGELSYEYMRTGSPSGWRSAVNEAIQQTKQPGTATVREHLRPNSPTMLMMDDLD